MSLIRAVIHDRKIEVPAPAELPDGTEVLVDLRPAGEQIGLLESEWDDSPEGIATWLDWLESLQPLILTAEEEAAIEAERRRQREWEKENFEARSQRLALDSPR